MGTTYSESLDRKDAFLILNGLPRIGTITLRKLLKQFNNDPIKVLSAQKEDLIKVNGVSEKISEVLKDWEKWVDYKQEKTSLEQMDARFLSLEDDAYPPLLKEIYDPPIGLYTMGPLEIKQNTVAIIGSRRATLYGTSIAEKLGAALAERGYCIASGLARGIDTAAHKGALSANGKTVAVMGAGLDRIYPPENADLYKEIKEKGSIITEFKLRTRADRMTFPRRNRILSGISQAVIVVESNSNGGSMLTAEFAAEQNRTVLAVPGRLDSEFSKGCHKLIRNGAILVSCIEDIIEELQHSHQLDFDIKLQKQIKEIKDTREHNLEGLAKDLFLRIKDQGPFNVNQLAEIFHTTIPELQLTLLKLEMEGYISKRTDGTFETK